MTNADRKTKPEHKYSKHKYSKHKIKNISGGAFKSNWTGGATLDIRAAEAGSWGSHPQNAIVRQYLFVVLFLVSANCVFFAKKTLTHDVSWLVGVPPSKRNCPAIFACRTIPSFCRLCFVSQKVSFTYMCPGYCGGFLPQKGTVLHYVLLYKFSFHTMSSFCSLLALQELKQWSHGLGHGELSLVIEKHLGTCLLKWKFRTPPPPPLPQEDWILIYFPAP